MSTKRWGPPPRDGTHRAPPEIDLGGGDAENIAAWG